MFTIKSSQNETFKKFVSLTLAKGLKKEKLFLLSGEKLIKEFLKKQHLKILYELTTSSLTPFLKDGTEVKHFSSELFAHIDVLGTHFNILVVEQPGIETLSAKDLETYVPQGIELVIPSGDPGNLGALIRSCEAFGVSRVILAREAAHPFLPKSVKASAGSVLRLSVAYGPALSAFPENCIALDVGGTSIHNFTWPASALLVVGEEGPGIGKNKFQRRIRIPTQGVQSLNVVVAASIALAHSAKET